MLLDLAGQLDTGTGRSGQQPGLCCDADLLPEVLGGPSIVLDVGRDRRLVPAEKRAALVLRDGGCVFPGCHNDGRGCGPS